MITGNFALIAGLAPRQVADWYLAVYVDAVDWVEEPNTLGMALNAWPEAETLRSNLDTL